MVIKIKITFSKQILIWLLKANVILWSLNFLSLILVYFFFNPSQESIFSSFLSKLSLLETGILLVVGGAISLSGSASSSKTRELLFKTNETWSMDKLKAKEKSANKYLLLAAIFFFESLFISFIGL